MWNARTTPATIRIHPSDRFSNRSRSFHEDFIPYVSISGFIRNDSNNDFDLAHRDWSSAPTRRSKSQIDPPFYGPFNGVFLPDGDGLKKPLITGDSLLRADSPWSLYAWVKPADALKMPMPGCRVWRYRRKSFRDISRSTAITSVCGSGKDNVLTGTAALAPGKWHFIAATFDGEQFRLYS